MSLETVQQFSGIDILYFGGMVHWSCGEFIARRTSRRQSNDVFVAFECAEHISIFCIPNFGGLFGPRCCYSSTIGAEFHRLPPDYLNALFVSSTTFPSVCNFASYEALAGLLAVRSIPHHESRLMKSFELFFEGLLSLDLNKVDRPDRITRFDRCHW
jgi:hypothetical protein